MLDIKWIRTNPHALDQSLIARGLKPCSEEILVLDEEHRRLTTLMQQLQHARKEKSRNISYIKNKSGSNFETAKKDVEHINNKLSELATKLEQDDQLTKIMDNLPNNLANDVPYGTDETMNQLIRSWGIPRNIENPKQHHQIGEFLKMMDFTYTAKISGNRFVTLKHDLAKLERALINFMIDVHTQEFHFSEVSPPYLVRNHAMYNVGQLPKFSDASFQTYDGYRLIPTGEVPLTNIFSDTILPREALPIRLVAYTPCFRSEAGSAGKDTKGMIRMHQFSKVELVTITVPEESLYEYQYLTNAAEQILQKLNLPYRVMLLCSGDISFAAQKTYDLEVWLPGQKCYREISSCSYFGDFQARRMKGRYKEFDSTESKFFYTINGSGLAIGRTIIAILENYQNSNGSVNIPEALVKYMGGQTIINPIKEKMYF